MLPWLTELILIAVVIGALLTHRGMRQWLTQLGPADLLTGGSIIAAILIFHVWDISRFSFPLVRWSMYAEIYEPEEMTWGKIQAELGDGTTVPINPAREFPSICRNFSERFRNLVVAADESELTPLGEQVYRELLQAIGHKYNQVHADRPAKRIKALLQTIEIQQGRPRTVDREISSITL